MDSRMRLTLRQAVLIARSTTNQGIMIDCGDRTHGSISPRYEEVIPWDHYDCLLHNHMEFAGFDVTLKTSGDARMLYVANFDDLFNRVQADAQPAAGPELNPIRPAIERGTR